MPNKKNPKFSVDSSGKVTITDGSISFSSLDQTTKDNISSANTAATEAKTAAAGAQATADAANGLASSANSLASSANSAAISAVNKVNGWTYGGTTYIDGTKIMTGTVMASKLLGGTVGLLDSDEAVVGSLDIVDTTYGYGLGINTAHGGIKISSATNVYLESGNGPHLLVGVDDNTNRPVISFGGGYLLLSGNYMFGSSLPTYAPYGTVFFLEA